MGTTLLESCLCGSQPYWRGMVCGPGIYVPLRAVEAEVFQGFNQVINLCTHPNGFTRQVNLELQQLWKKCTGNAARVEARKQLGMVDEKTANVRGAIEKGWNDVEWANGRLREVTAERDTLTASLNATEPPRLDSKTVMTYRLQTEELIEFGQPAERKRLLRVWAQKAAARPNRSFDENQLSSARDRCERRGCAGPHCTERASDSIPI